MDMQKCQVDDFVKNENECRYCSEMSVFSQQWPAKGSLEMFRVKWYSWKWASSTLVLLSFPLFFHKGTWRRCTTQSRIISGILQPKFPGWKEARDYYPLSLFISEKELITGLNAVLSPAQGNSLFFSKLASIYYFKVQLFVLFVNKHGRYIDKREWYTVDS